MKYTDWIQKHVKSPKGKCYQYCEDMRVVFPELRLAYGKYGNRGHFWLLGEDDEIIDPTVGQFTYPEEYELIWRSC